MATQISTRLRRIMRARQWTQADLVKASGASQPTVSRWMADGRITMTPAYAFRLQDNSGFSARWILLNEGPENIRDVAEQIIRDTDIHR